MADRHNLCLNPALGVDVTGWGGGSTPARVSVTGFSRPTAAEYTTGSYASTAATGVGAVTVGLAYTVSVYVRTVNFNVNSGSIYVEWLTSGGSGFGYPAASYSLAAATIGRVSVTATAPTGAVACRAIVDGINLPINPTHFTMVLIEQAPALDIYFDGDTSPGGSWDGTPGLSGSTLTTSQNASGATALPSRTAIAPAGTKAGLGATVNRSSTALITPGAKGGTATPSARAGATTAAQGVKGATKQAAAKAGAALAATGTKDTSGHATQMGSSTLIVAAAKHAHGFTSMTAGARLAASVPGAVELTHLGGVLLDTGVLGGSLT